MGKRKLRLSYKLKVFANKGKLRALEILVQIWQEKVNYYINLYWKLPDWELERPKPPKEFRGQGSKFENLASVKAWQIVRSIKKSKKERPYTKPVFKKLEFELDETLFAFGDFTTKEFDLWIKSYSGNPGRRIVIPLKKHRRLNYWLKKGAVPQRTIKFKKINNIWYTLVFLSPPKVERKKTRAVIGIDVDYTNGAVDSIGKVWLSSEWIELRKRTKWRKYPDRNNPLRQKLNQIAKEMVNTYQCHFALEKLELKGKKGRSKKFRRDTKNIPYGHLAKRLETLTALEGFRTVRVSPEYTSQTCPVCGHVYRKNRDGDNFYCKRCGFKHHADIVAACNIAIKAGLWCKFQPVVVQAVAEGWGRLGIRPPVGYLVAWTPSQSRPPADLRRCDPPCQICLFN